MENVKKYINSSPEKDQIDIIETFKSKLGPATITFRFNKGRTIEDYTKNYLEIMKQIMELITDVEYPKISLSTKVKFIKSEDRPIYTIQSHSYPIISKKQIDENLNILLNEIKTHIKVKIL